MHQTPLRHKYKNEESEFCLVDRFGAVGVSSTTHGSNCKLSIHCRRCTRCITMGSKAPLTITGPLSTTSMYRSRAPMCGAARALVASVIWMPPTGQVLSVLEAMLTVWPKTVKRRRIFPAIPDMAGPLWMPVIIKRVRERLMVWRWYGDD